MRTFTQWLLFIGALALCVPTWAQVTNIEVRVSGDLWKLSYTAASSQINCGLCPKIIAQEPLAQGVIDELQDSVIHTRYVRPGVRIAVGASLFSPAFRLEMQVGPSMRKLNDQGEDAGRYVNRNISAFVGVNPLQLSEFAGKFYLGSAQRLFLDMSDMGFYMQFSYDGGFEEYVRSTNNMAMLVRAQPTLWLSDDRQLGISLRGGLRMWLLGNGSEDGPFSDSNGLPKKIRPNTDWFIGLAIKFSPSGALKN